MKTNDKINPINRKNQTWTLAFVGGLFILSFSCPSSAGPFEPLMNADKKKATALSSTKAEILKSSQISYRAQGGFTGVQSFGVIISCVKGRVSVMKSIYDPRLPESKSRIRQIGTLDQGDYLNLWANLKKSALLKMENAPLPRQDIADEFTVHFYAKVGNGLHSFNVQGITRPEAARYFALQKLIDNCVQMGALWGTHQNLAKHLEKSDFSAEATIATPPF